MQAPYHLLLFSILTVFLFLISHTLVNFGIWTKTNHRKLWNVLLLLTFLATAIPGLLLAIQINYKLEWPWVEKMLKWHVNAGIVLSIVAVIHIAWHFSYYTRIFKKSNPEKSVTKSEPAEHNTHEPLLFIILVSGFASTIIQVLLMREITAIFQGNEFMMAWTLGIWMLLTGTGAWLGRYINKQACNTTMVIKLITTIVIFAPFTGIVLNLARESLFLPGVLISPPSFLLINFIFLLPVCLLTGILFSVFVHIKAQTPEGFIQVYILEALGSMAGGLIVSILLINRLAILKSLILLLCAVLLVLFIVFKTKKKLIQLSLAVLFFFALLAFPLENLIRSGLFPHQTIVENKESFYGNITVTEYDGEYNFFSNGSLIFSSGNYIVSEEYAHYALLQRQNAEYVLIVSDGISGIAHEVLKYPSVKKIDYIGINPRIIQIGKKYNLMPDDSRVNINYTEASQFLFRSAHPYNAVILSVADPSSLQSNRFYTNDFLIALKKSLADKGIVIYGISPSGNYLSASPGNKLAVIVNTLKAHFRHVEILPGEKDYLLASDGPVSLNISSLYDNSGLNNQYVNSDYIDDATMQMRSKSIVNNLPDIEVLNTNNRPLPVFYDTLNYISQFYANKLWIAYLPVLLLIIPLIFMRPESAGMYTAGLTGASVEILLIFIFQLIYGYVYSAIGIIVALFMCGLAIGAFAGKRMAWKQIHIAFMPMVLFLVLLLIPFAFKLFGLHISHLLFWLVFILLTLFPSAGIGYYYVLGTNVHNSKHHISAPAMYAADLAGSSLGVIISTTLFIPVLGIAGTCYALAVLNLVVALLFFLRKKKY